MKSKSSSKIIFLVSNDLIYDQRVQRHAKLMMENDFEVLLLGRLKSTTNTNIKIDIPSARFKLPFERSWLFYASLNIRFFFYLLFRKFEVVWSNDLDTLPVAFLIAKIRGKKLFYDSHEFFTGVPELQNRKLVSGIWGSFEKFLLNRIEFKITVSNGVKALYKQVYNSEFEVVRNIGNSKFLDEKAVVPNVLGFSFDQHFVIYQGALNKDRGLESLILAMKDVADLKLLIVGSGDIDNELKQIVVDENLLDKVFFTGMIEPSNLRTITPKAIAGLSIEIPSNENYSNCLPNKFFDYLEAEIPIIAYPNKEVKFLVEKFELGVFIENHHPKSISKVLNEFPKDWKNNLGFKNHLFNAKKELNWETESKKLINYFSLMLDK